MKTTKLIIAAGLLALLSSCSDTVDAGSNSLVQPTGKLSFIVRDNETKAALKGVKAELLTTGKIVTTGADGIVSFDDVYAGDYKVQLTGPGYATRLSDLYTSVESDVDGVYIVGNKTTEPVVMYPTTASVEGTVKYQPKATTAVPLPTAVAAANAWVYIKLSSSTFVNSVDSVQTDASGKYTFANQPAGTTASVCIKLFENAGNKYSSTSCHSSVSLTAGITTYPSTALTFSNSDINEPPTITP